MAFAKGRRAEKYGHAHTLQRRAWAAHHRDDDPCGWCGRPLGPMGPRLHLAHDPTGTVVLGFWHRACNIREAAKRARAKQNAHQSSLRW